MKGHDSSLDDFNEKFNLICSYIGDGHNDMALELLSELYEQYKLILGYKHRGIIHCKFVLAQLNAEAGNIPKAKFYFDTSINEIKSCVDLDSRFTIEAQITHIRFLISIQDFTSAVLFLEELCTTLKDDIEHNKKDYLAVIDLLASIYGIQNEHQKSVEISSEMLNILMEEHQQKYGDVITKDNIGFEPEVLNKIISIYLGIGASLSRMGEFHDAKQYLEQGYFLSYTTYGDEDERTLKLNYNLAANEMQGIDQKEGIRQLHFVYNDMLKYLGNDNKYTKKAYDVLKMLGESVEIDSTEKN